jgi:hypothetical protein
VEAVSVLPQLRMMQKTKVVERFTANYVFALGGEVQVDPLKLPGAKILKPKCDILLSNSAVKFNLRRCSWASRGF